MTALAEANTLELDAPRPPVSEADVQALETELLKHPQADCPVVHRFAPGLYIRELTIPADTYVIGHKQTTHHLNIMLAGHIILTNEDGTRTELVAPQVFVGPPGRKIAYAVETVVWQNIYPTTETDVATLEATYLDKSYAWQVAQRDQQMLLSFGHPEDIADFHLAIAKYGFDADTVRRISEDPADQIPFPLGSYKVMVGPSPIEGQGLFATSPIAEGEMIAPGRIDGMRTPAGRYTNHSKKPNAVAVLADNGDIHLFATCDIVGCKGGDLGDEITLDYRQALGLASRRD
jgi:hypothetical protein